MSDMGEWGGFDFRSLSPGVLSQVKLKQWGTDLVKPSQSLSLTCAAYGYSITCASYGWNWICQPPGKSLEWMGSIWHVGRTNYSTSLKSHNPILQRHVQEPVLSAAELCDHRGHTVYYCTRGTVM
jgi:immunoglobulin heavy chain